jgi:hypothetical protein
MSTGPDVHVRDGGAAVGGRAPIPGGAAGVHPESIPYKMIIRHASRFAVTMDLLRAQIRLVSQTKRRVPILRDGLHKEPTLQILVKSESAKVHRLTEAK